MRLLAAFFFLLLLWLTDKAIQADNASLSQFKDLRNPSADTIGPIPPCEADALYEGTQDCYDFIYSPEGDAVTEELVANIRLSNQGRPIPAEKVQGFADRRAADAFLQANTEVTNGAVHFSVQPDGSDISFVLQTNTTAKYFKGDFQNANTFLQMPLQVAAHRAILELQLQKEGITLDLPPEVSTKEFAHPSLDTLSIVSQAGGVFIYAACMFGFITLLSNVVMEREQGLRQSLSTMGMLDSAYYVSWALWELLMSLASTLVIMVSGYIFQFKIMKDNNFFVSFFLYLLFQMALSAFGFALTPFIRRSSLAIYLGFVIFLVGWIMQLVVAFGYPYEPEYKGQPLYIIFSFFPWTVFYKGILDLGRMTATAVRPGISWSNRASYCVEAEESTFATGCNSQESICECVLPINTIYGILIALYFGYLLLAVYLDQVLPNENRVGNVPWYFLLPRYWNPTFRAHKRRRTGDEQPLHEYVQLQPTVPVPAETQQALPSAHAAGASGTGVGAAGGPPGASGGNGQALAGSRQDAAARGLQSVRDEKGKLQAMLQETGEGRKKRVLRMLPLDGAQRVAGNARDGGAGTAQASMADGTSGHAPKAVEVYGLQKRYGKDFWAVRENWFDIQEGTVFCLLGPNGAGKTTTINCLTGVHPLTGGDALICGKPLSNPASLPSIRAQMGVCPQFDVLWPELTAREHLQIFAWVKGVPQENIGTAVAKALEQVSLTDVQNGRVTTYSGGMRRRLCVAIAFLGQPRVVYLDECTTGMDPISRRGVWDIIENAKPGRAIVLTTHSMEEADILGDRIGIMARGRMRVVGTSISLKRMFGSGYQLTVALQRSGGAAAAARVKDFFKQHLDLVPEEEGSSYQTYLVPLALEARIPGAISELQARRDELGCGDVQVGMSSLEEVFLSIARQAEMDAAAAKGEVQAFRDASGQEWNIPAGADTVAHPLTGQIHRVQWTQDAHGALQVADVRPINMDQT